MKTRRPSVSVHYAYLNQRGKLCVAVNPPNFPLPDDAIYWDRDPDVTARWVAENKKKLEAA